MDTATYTDTLLLIDGEWCASASGKTIDVVVYDECADSDCSGCCTRNANQNGYGFLIDIESYTAAKFGVSADGTVEWYCTDCK